MTKPNWTPGPWEVQELTHSDGELWLQIGASGFGPIAGVTADETREPTFKPVAGMKYLVTPKPEIRANARLIAQAPAMVTVINQFLLDIEDGVDPIGVGTTKEARAILAKIEGGGDE